jgi:hypothetical protein
MEGLFLVYISFGYGFLFDSPVAILFRRYASAIAASFQNSSGSSAFLNINLINFLMV